MKKIAFTIVFALLASLCSQSNVLANDQGTIRVGVKGMTCSFCTRGIRKRFEKLPAVESAAANVDENRVTLKLRKDQNITDEEIKKVVDDSGYELTSINREGPTPIPVNDATPTPS